MREEPHQDAVDSATREAAEWFARLRSDDVSEEDRARFQFWLEMDPRHRDAYAGFERFWSASGDYAADRNVARAVRDAERGLEPEPAEPAPRPEPRMRPGLEPPPLQRHARRLALAACVTAVAVAAAVFLQPLIQESRGIYVTSVGEQRSVPLADGSRVTLNTDTRIRVAYSDAGRDIRLERGQAYFRVAKDAQRPFRVRTRNGVVRAVGTEFEVYQNDRQVVVTVVEGSVAVSDETADDTTRTDAITDARETPAAETVLQASERIALAPGMTLEPEKIPEVPLQRSMAWTGGRLIFDDEPLRDAVAEINRYSEQRVLIGDENLESVRISGVFRVGDVEDFVHSISRYFAMRVQSNRAGNYVLMPV